jgi:hypothetical protein
MDHRRLFPDLGQDHEVVHIPDELFSDGRLGEFGTVYRVFRRPDPRMRASIDFNHRPSPISWLSEGAGMGSSASDSTEDLLFT